MQLAVVMGPAIRLAENGFAVSEKLEREFREEKKVLERFPMSRRIFLNEGKMLKMGDTLKQPELAATLKRIAKSGAQGVYGGETGRLSVAVMVKYGGLVQVQE